MKGRYSWLQSQAPIWLLGVFLLAGCTTLKRCAYQGFGRDEWQKPDEVIRSLKIKAGESVADLGSGSGYFTFRLARAIGPTGRVYAADIDAGLNEDIANRARAEGYTNIQTILARPDDPLLRNGVDMIFLTNVYHYLHDRTAYFARAKQYLRPNGRVIIIDFNSKQWFDIFGGHYTPGDVIRREMEEAGYRLQEEFSFLPRQYFFVFSIR
ncbi:MAG: class I SAM-dependent methyltransferase [Deltaproteobacteria bacterium]|nr:class I SAM-dependent methyltransferase [Deltaproteobacteria bacterium]